MKVGLISSHSFVNPGGVKSHILGLSNAFDKMGIENKIIVPRRKFFENYDKKIIILGASIPFNVAGTQGDICFNFNPLTIKKIIKQEKFDVLHFHNFIIPFAEQILKASRCLNILTFHANLEAMPVINKASIISKLFFDELNKKIDGVIGVAKLNLDSLQNYSGPKIIIPNGINLDSFNPNALKIEKFAQDNKIKILFVGRIEERKGLIYLLEAYKILKQKYPEIELIIVGEGGLKNKCLGFTHENNLKDVYFEGEKNDEELKRYFATADIYCSPAIFGESFGIVLLEAMAMGKPICGFANSGYQQLLANTQAEKFLAEPKNSNQLAKILEQFIANPKLRQQMGEWGLKYVQQYSWDKIAHQVIDFYQYCLDIKKSKS